MSTATTLAPDTKPETKLDDVHITIDALTALKHWLYIQAHNLLSQINTK